MLAVVNKKQTLDWSEILPCPFCSNPGKLISTSYSGDKTIGESAFVLCETCGAAGPMLESGENYENTKLIDMEKLAIKKWNRRGNLVGAEEKLRIIARVLNSNAE